jgi:hypothetical protein
VVLKKRTARGIFSRIAPEASCIAISLPVFISVFTLLNIIIQITAVKKPPKLIPAVIKAVSNEIASVISLYTNGPGFSLHIKKAVNTTRLNRHVTINDKVGGSTSCSSIKDPGIKIRVSRIAVITVNPNITPSLLLL